MIFQLIKRHQGWWGMPIVFTVFYALIAVGSRLAPLTAATTTREAMQSVFLAMLGFYMLFMVWLVLNLQTQWALLDAALPIAGRCVWLSRILISVVTIWLPAAAAAIFGLPPMRMLAAASLVTALTLATECFGIGQLGAPRWFGNTLSRILFVVLPIALFLRRNLKQVHWPAPPSAAIVFTICAAASVGLFLWGLAGVPKSFQFAPLKAGTRSETQVRERSSGVALAPVLASILQTRQISILFLFVVVYMATGHYGNSVLAAVPFLRIPGACRWLLPLPFSNRTLFALAVAPSTLAILAGAVAREVFASSHPLTPRATLIEVATDIAGAYLLIALASAAVSRSLSRLPVWIRWAPFALAFVGDPFHSGDGLYNNVAAALPLDWLQLAALLAILLGACYWLAQTAFAAREYRARYIETRNIHLEGRLA